MGIWIMYGIAEDDPKCIYTVEEAITYIDEAGFLPLFRNDITGFSLERGRFRTIGGQVMLSVICGCGGRLLPEAEKPHTAGHLTGRRGLFPENCQ